MANSDKDAKPSNINSDVILMNEMGTALIAITNEIQKFPEFFSSAITNESIEYHEYVFKKFIECKSRLCSKKQLIHKLKENIRVACFIVKTLMSAKRNGDASTNVHWRLLKIRYEDLIEIEKDKEKSIVSLTKENRELRNEVDNIREFIEHGYQELLKADDQSYKELPTIVQLKNIVLLCGQYYAKYRNLQQKNQQLEHKNSFLKNKLSIINHTLDAATRELRNVRNQNLGLHKENAFLKCKTVTKEGNALSLAFTNYLKRNRSETNTYNISKFESVADISRIDLKSHLNLVQKLLSDQDEILKELKWLSEDSFKSE